MFITQSLSAVPLMCVCVDWESLKCTRANIYVYMCVCVRFLSRRLFFVNLSVYDFFTVLVRMKFVVVLDCMNFVFFSVWDFLFYQCVRILFWYIRILFLVCTDFVSSIRTDFVSSVRTDFVLVLLYLVRTDFPSSVHTNFVFSTYEFCVTWYKFCYTNAYEFCCKVWEFKKFLALEWENYLVCTNFVTFLCTFFLYVLWLRLQYVRMNVISSSLHVYGSVSLHHVN